MNRHLGDVGSCKRKIKKQKERRYAENHPVFVVRRQGRKTMIEPVSLITGSLCMSAALQRAKQSPAIQERLLQD
jgi:hypothetical protein